MPWMRTFHSENSLCGNGGRMYQCTRSTTRPSRTFTSPTEQADALDGLAVSKSIAVKSTGTRSIVARGSDTAGRAAGRVGDRPRTVDGWLAAGRGMAAGAPCRRARREVRRPDDRAARTGEEAFAATNDGDLGRFVAAFAADGVIDDWGREFRGP